MKILIAEDDHTSRMFLQRYFERYGLCIGVIDGIEALNEFRLAHNEGKPYDLILLDIMMPNMDGIKVLKEIREMEKQMRIEKEKLSKIIMATALIDTPFIANAFDIGCDAYAYKPIDLERMAEVLKTIGIDLSKEKK